MNIKITMNAVDITNYVRLDTIEVDAALGQNVTTCSFIADDITGVVDPIELKVVVLTNAAETVKYFAGIVASVTNVIEGIGIVHHVECQDYTLLTEMAIVNETYLAKTDKFMIDDMFTDNLSEISTAGITETGIPAPTMVFNYTSIRAALDQISKITGMEWYIDYDKVLHYHAPAEQYASFDLSDAPDNSATFPYYDFQYARDATRIINVVTVVGAWYKSSDITTEFAADGQQTLFKLPYSRIQAPAANPAVIQVWRNTNIEGTPTWTAKTVGLANTEDSGSFDVMFNFGEATLEWAVAPPAFYDAWKMTYRYAVAIAQTSRDQPSITAYGREYHKKVVDKDVQSFEQAEQRGRQILNEQANVKTILSLKHNQDGAVVGQRQKVTHALFGLDGYYTISKIRMIFRRSSTAEYICTLAGSHPNDDILDNLRELNRLVNFHESNPDEQTFQLFSLDESMALAHATPIAGTETTQDYTWGASGSGKDLDWSLGTWA
uniref:Tail protein n=1 Tax=viral metagenome TaxID=1070528 RepID=A0A6M3L407_9ZZZZ